MQEMYNSDRQTDRQTINSSVLFLYNKTIRYLIQLLRRLYKEIVNLGSFLQPSFIV